MTSESEIKTTKPEKRLSGPDRRDRLALLLAQSGYLSISQLAEHLNVSEMTIRRDLDQMVEKGVAERAHGGAVPITSTRTWGIDLLEPEIDERIQRNSDAKARIGKLAASLVEPGQTIALDIGSTALCMAHAVKDMDIRVFTYSLKIALFLSSGVPRLYMPGGEIRGSEPSAVGSMTRNQLKSFRFDWAFLGASGLANEGLFDYSLEDAEVKRAMIESAERRAVLLDSSKFGRLSIVKITDLSSINALVCDQEPTGSLAEKLHEAGVKVCVAE
ncbi:DeoR/GlpR family DNA-binding transcription regulator [Pelagibius sp. CAU 1746]|uniref:DeoR/GlpR family DNA-binding transcription regulator n=1 Tax=Pelagibius sp. CAU 1746 TaxID=3140370 RepID=UPI00325A4BC8